MCILEIGLIQTRPPLLQGGILIGIDQGGVRGGGDGGSDSDSVTSICVQHEHCFSWVVQLAVAALVEKMMKNKLQVGCLHLFLYVA